MEGESFDYLLKLSEIFNKVNEAASSVDFIVFNGNSTDGKVIQGRQNVVTAVNTSISEDKRIINSRKLTRYSIEVEDLVVETFSYLNESSSLRKLLLRFLNKMERFLEHHESYRRSYAPGSAYSLSFASQDFSSSVDEVKLAIDTILDSYLLSPEKEASHGIELYLSHVPSLKQFGSKLNALDTLYTEISNIFDVSVAENPIEIDHLEDGSLLVRFLGHPMVIGIVTSVIAAGASYYIANYTVNREAVELRESVDTLDKMFDLTQKLKEAGHNVDEMEDQIAVTLKKLAKASDVLLSDQPSIEVNDRVFELHEHDKPRLIEQNKQKLLDYKEFDQEI